MSFNIEEFRSELGKRGSVMKTNRFLVTFPMPIGLFDGTGELLRANQGFNRTTTSKVEYWCESVNLPGYQLLTHDVRRWTYGPAEKRPFAPNFTQLQCNFISDGRGRIYNLFNDWMNLIMPHDTKDGFNADSKYGGNAYEVKYKTQYVTDLNIKVFSESGKEILTLVCKEAFPSHMLDIPLNWGDTNSYVKFQVAFDFLDWYINVR